MGSLTPLSEKLAAGWVLDPVTGCHVWTKSRTAAGYGQTSHKNRKLYAHRVAYVLAKGEIPKGIQIDHLCRNRACCNPNHLEAVVQAVNILRGEGFSAKKARQTHCVNGHELAGANLYQRKDRPGASRDCKRCMYDRNLARSLRLKAAP